MDKRISSGVGPGGRISRVLANSPYHQLAINVDRGFGLESASVREWRRLRESACINLRR